MAATKVRTSIWAAQSLTAGAGNTTSSAIDLSAGYGAQLDISLVNGTAPTIPAQVQIQVANDVAGTLFTNYGGPLVAGVTASTTYSWSISLPIGVTRLQLIAGSNTTNAVTVNSDISLVTTL